MLALSPDPVTGYPRWQGELSPAPKWVVIAKNEALLGYRDRWVGYAFILFLALAGLRYSFSVGSGVGRGGAVDDFVDMLKVLDWGALAVAAIMAGPALFEDSRRGALELYLSRGASRFDYLFGKALAIFGMAFAVVAGPALVYYLSTFLFSQDHPAGWGWMWAGILGHALVWALIIAGLGLALSAALRSSIAATLVLFGGVFGLDLILSNLLNFISKDDRYQLLSPVADLAQQSTWLFPGAKAPYSFPAWWSLLVLGGLAVLGWAVFAWRAPRVKGAERA